MDSASQTIKLEDGRTLGFAEYGDPKGKPLFYFHGWPASRLGAEKYHVLAKKLHVRYKGPELDLKLYTTAWGFTLRDIVKKMYLWYGADDQNVSLNMGKYYAREIPKSRLIIYPGEGHLISITHAEKIFKTLSCS